VSEECSDADTEDEHEHSIDAPQGKRDSLKWDKYGAAAHMYGAKSWLDNAGKGGFAKHNITAGTEICIYGGKRMSYRKAKSPSHVSDYVYTYDSDALQFGIDAYDVDKKILLAAGGLINDSLASTGPRK